MLSFEKIELEKLNIDEYNNFNDKLIFQTVEWIDFLMQTQKVAPIILRICEGEKFIGYFTGFLFKKFGIKIVGSSFRGWSTMYMGFNLIDGYERVSVIKELWPFLKKEYNCAYCEILDRFITIEQAEKAGLTFQIQASYGIDIGGDEQDLLLHFSKHCRKQIRQSEKKDISIVCVPADDDFAKEYYSQLVEVFAYQKLSPPYDLKRVQVLIKKLAEIDAVHCLKAITGDGRCVGTSISFGYNKRCYTWGSTSIRGEGCDYLQSEALRWSVIKHWRERGCFDYDMVGKRDYKLKFNPFEIEVPRIILTKHKFLITLRDFAQKLYWKLNSLKNKI